MDFFDLDPRELPTATLYRVQYDGCMTIHDHFSGLTARGTKTIYTERDFRGAVEDHLCWERVHLSIFISLFANKRHAENWALDWNANHHGRPCEVFKINASELAGLYVFHADEIRKYLNLHVPSKAKASILDEYLIAYSVPQRAIVGRQSTKDIQRGR